MGGLTRTRWNFLVDPVSLGVRTRIKRTYRERCVEDGSICIIVPCSCTRATSTSSPRTELGEEVPP